MAATRLSFSYPQEMKDELLELAKADSRTLSSYVQRVLADHLKKVSSAKSGQKPSGKKRPARKRKRAEAAS